MTSEVTRCRGRPRKSPAVKPVHIRPDDLLRTIMNTDYANVGLKTGSHKIYLPGTGVYVSSNCFRGLLGKGKGFIEYVTFLNIHKRVPMTFSVYCVCVLTKIISEGQPRTPTINDLQRAYRTYINDCKMWK